MSGQLGIDGSVQPVRVCACGCGQSLDEMRKDAKWVSRAHAVRWGRAHPGQSLCEAWSANRGRTHTRSSVSGLQLSYRKTQIALEQFLESRCFEAPRSLSVSLLMGVLSDRQRQMLRDRKRAQQAPALSVAEQREAYRRREELEAA